MTREQKRQITERFTQRWLTGCWFFLLMIVGSTALDQRAAGQEFNANLTAEQLPTAGEVIDRYIERMGGYELLASRESVHIAYDATKNDEAFEYEIFIAPGQYYSSSRYENGRWFERGINDGVAWTRIDGVARQLEGDELRGILARHRNVCRAPHWVDESKSIKVIGVQTVEGRPAFCLKFTDHVGAVTVRYFDCKSYLLMRSESTEVHGGHRTLVRRDYSGYQTIGESLVPLYRRIVSGSKTYQYTVKQFEVDVRIPKGTFDLPPNVERPIASTHR